MFLRKLVIGSAAVAALGASAVVLADGNVAVPSAKDSGFYVTGAAGYSWVGSGNSRTLNLSSIPATPIGSPAATGSVLPTIQQASNNNGGVAGRLGVGYSLNKYFGLETGFNLYNPTYREINEINNGVFVANGVRVKTSVYSADLLGKVTLPIGRFFAFVDGGGAYVHTHTQPATYTYQSTLGSTPVTVWSNSSTKSYFRPEAGAGLGVNVTSSLAVDVSYSRLFGTGSITSQNYLADINTGLVGLTYKF